MGGDPPIPSPAAEEESSGGSNKENGGDDGGNYELGGSIAGLGGLRNSEGGDVSRK